MARATYQGNALMSYTTDAKVSLFSAGGDVSIWNNGHNLNLVEKHSGVGPVDLHRHPGAHQPGLLRGQLRAVAGERERGGGNR